MHKHTSTAVKAILDELVAGGQMLQEILVIDIVHFNNLVSKTFE